MVFSSVTFVFLALPFVLLAYFVLPVAARNAWLLIASLFFYAWGGLPYLPVLLGVVSMNYVFGLFVSDERAPRTRTVSVTIAIVCNLLVLGTFKYANFAVDNLNVFLAACHVSPLVIGKVQLPIGISFFTFHSMSYVLDVYRNDAKVQRNPFLIGLYLIFFPQLIAGPIVRYHHIANQFTERQVTVEGFAYGIRRFVIGLAKKVVLANTFAVPADEIFGLPAGQLTPALAWIGIVSYTLQIYFDFSGYSDMAIGLARMFGFHFVENFQWPYIAQSVREFWRRWHISLSTWFRDYLYLPLGGNRGSALRTYFNLVLVFFLCGLWHGASWNFIVWGLYHGGFLVLERLRFGRWVDALPHAARHAYLLLVVMVGWVFFRADTLSHAMHYLGSMAGLHHGIGALRPAGAWLRPDYLTYFVCGLVAATPVVPFLARRFQERESLHGVAEWGATVATLALFAISAVSLSGGTHNPFIYFRF